MQIPSATSFAIATEITVARMNTKLESCVSQSFLRWYVASNKAESNKTTMLTPATAKNSHHDKLFVTFQTRT